MGTCTFCAPSTRIFVELGNAVEKSDMPLSLHPPTHGEGESGSKGLLSIPDGIPLAVKVRLYQGQRAKGKGQRAEGRGHKGISAGAGGVGGGPQENVRRHSGTSCAG